MCISVSSGSCLEGEIGCNVHLLLRSAICPLLGSRALSIPVVANPKTWVSLAVCRFPHFRQLRELSGSIVMQVALTCTFCQLEKLETTTAFIRTFESSCFFWELFSCQNTIMWLLEREKWAKAYFFHVKGLICIWNTILWKFRCSEHKVPESQTSSQTSDKQ